MDYTNCFPILTDEMVDVYEGKVTELERAELDVWFGVKEKFNEQPQAGHVISVSLFWKHVNAADGELPEITRDIFLNAGRLGLVKRLEPWPSYVQPILDAAQEIRILRPDIVIRVHLAADLEFLIPDLVEVGCEVWLMAHSSIRLNPGAMWRHLALEETGRLVTVLDSDLARDYAAHVERTELMHEHGLGFWRVPHAAEPSGDRELVYLPILGSYLGSAMALPNVAQLMKATVWYSLQGTTNDYCNRPGYGPQKFTGTTWPGYSYDEFFLRLAIYPRVAFHGMLTLVPAGTRSLFLPMDIEYCTWANANAELIYFGDDESAKPPGSGGKRKPRNRDCNRVLLTGMWKLETASDVILILELFEFAKLQDMPVEVKPILHVQNESRLAELPQELVAAAVIWRGKFSAYIQGAYVRILSLESDADWIWQADSDERVDFASVGGLKAVLRKANAEGADYVEGEWVDRIASSKTLPPLKPLKPGECLGQAFPIAAKAVESVGHGWQAKIALNHRNCLTISGNHVVEDKDKLKASFQIVIWHFKWHADCLANQRLKLQADRQWPWAWHMESLVNTLEEEGGSQIAWEAVTASARVKLKAEWGSGAYPCTHALS